MSRVSRITSEIKKLDHNLFCVREDNVLIIKRNRYVPEHFYLDEDLAITYLRNRPDNVCYLTHNWSVKGQPVEWGLDNILFKLHKMDAWNRDVFKEVVDQNEKVDLSEKRAFKNELEAWASDVRPVFKKAFSDINTSTVVKNDRRVLKDKQIKK